MDLRSSRRREQAFGMLCALAVGGAAPRRPGPVPRPCCPAGFLGPFREGGRTPERRGRAPDELAWAQRRAALEAGRAIPIEQVLGRSAPPFRVRHGG